jgi:hypothetical protein
MRSHTLILAVLATAFAGFAHAQPTPKDTKLTEAAEFTRTKSLKGKVSLAANDARLGDVLKEIAAQLDMRSDMLVMWAYGPNFPYTQKVTYSCKDRPLDVVLDELLSKAGAELGYIIVSKEGDKRDGWILLTTTGERGTERQPATEEEETAAAERLTLAKKLIDGGKPDAAKPVLTLITKKYPTTKAATEAKQLLAKMEK